MNKYVSHPNTNSEGKGAEPGLPPQPERLSYPYQSTLESFDERGIRGLCEASELSEFFGIAIENALMAHPITQYVKTKFCEPSNMYPAISDTYRKITDIIHYENTGKWRKNYYRRKSAIVYDGPEEIPFVRWHLPMQQKSKSCGIYNIESKKDLCYKACMRDKNDYASASVFRCWRLACESCGNATAVRLGIFAEQKLLAPIDIEYRKTGHERKFKHWVISPPQEWFSRIMQRADHYHNAFDDIVELIQKYGMDNGLVVFHPWRWNTKNQIWEIGPHFHIVSTGFFHNEPFRNEMKRIAEEYSELGTGYGDGEWVIKQIHPEAPVRSIRHTIAYILTHCGIGIFTYSVNWNDEMEDLLHPVIKNGNQEFYKTISKHEYDLDWESTGLVTEHLDRVDWVEWACRSVTAKFQAIRYFGLCNKTRILSYYKERVVSKCPICGEAMGLYHGYHDINPDPVIYARKSTIRVMAEDYDQVKDYYDKNKNKLDEDGNTILDYAMALKQCSTPETMGVQKYESSKTREERIRLYQNRKDLAIAFDKMLHPHVIPKKHLSEFKKEN